MARRIDVELTSKRDDGRWTWRAAGAKQPKGELDGTILYEGAKVGDVVKADADFAIDGIVITAVIPPKEKKRSEPERVEIVGPPRDERGVTTSLTGKPERPDRGRSDRGRPDGARPDRGRSDRGRPSRGDQGRGGPRGDHADAERPARSERPAPPDGADRRPPRGPRPEAGRPPRAEHAAGQRQHPERRPRPDAPAPAPRSRKLNPGHTHRDAVLAGLPPEQRPIAEQALRGGLPGVRQAVEAQNAELRQQGQPEFNPQPLLAIAEQLLPQLKAADWRDRAEAAAKMVDELSIRDLRAVVTGADAARDDDGRLLAGTLREALERRLQEQREGWLAEITTAVEEGRLVRALRLSARSPDAGIRFPAELALRLSDAAGKAMAPDAPPDRWQAVLDAVADSPVRRSVKPAGLPADAPEEVLQAARQASGKVPALAGLLGISMPPPPGPRRPVRPVSGAGRAHRSPADRSPAIPPPPPPAAAETSPPATPADDAAVSDETPSEDATTSAPASQA